MKIKEQNKSILIEYRDNVAVLRLNRGVTNPINPQLLNELSESLREVKENTEIHALIIASSNNKFFSIGLDIPELFDLSREAFTVFYKTFNRVCIDLYTLPMPTISAVTGHAIAGGCILALCCDHRFIAEGKKLMGLNEVHLGVPVPYPADCILRDLVGTRYARDITGTGEFYQPEVLLQMGMVDHVLPLEQVLPRSMEKAGLLGALPYKAYEMTKRNRVEMVEKRILKHLEVKEQFFLDCWYSENARARLKEAMEKF